MHPVAVRGGLHRFGECGILDDGVEQTVQAHEEASIRGVGNAERPTRVRAGGVLGYVGSVTGVGPVDNVWAHPPQRYRLNSNPWPDPLTRPKDPTRARSPRRHVRNRPDRAGPAPRPGAGRVLP
ncbi:hypothetical protein GCM10010094_32300 [Streptomyces flaveus]|uniref:Uncharacterized protein n=1 Tax=Streptomyces flaveus TaxID=66370 RepID=A0A917QUA7_9ACTN|nr:hypothetical protein GCM10010094_32300 [Streptomyces flaveus]